MKTEDLTLEIVPSQLDFFPQSWLKTEDPRLDIFRGRVGNSLALPLLCSRVQSTPCWNFPLPHWHLGLCKKNPYPLPPALRRAATPSLRRAASFLHRVTVPEVHRPFPLPPCPLAAHPCVCVRAWQRAPPPGRAPPTRGSDRSRSIQAAPCPTASSLEPARSALVPIICSARTSSARQRQSQVLSKSRWSLFSST